MNKQTIISILFALIAIAGQAQEISKDSIYVVGVVADGFTVCRGEHTNENSLILQYLGEYHSSVTLDDLSKRFSRSKSHLSHMFKKENGMSVRAYCNMLKINDAKNLLRNTELSVSDIAYDTGFDDVSYFIYTFRKETGITPLQYRKNLE